MRLVRRPDGVIVVDASGRLPGRGAYLHAAGACVASARKRASVERSLRGSVPAETWAEIGRPD